MEGSLCYQRELYRSEGQLLPAPTFNVSLYASLIFCSSFDSSLLSELSLPHRSVALANGTTL